MSRWIQTSHAAPRLLDQLREDLGDDEVIPSPYEVPDSFRVVSTRKGSMRVELRYIDGTEPIGARHRVNSICIELGKYSSRILAIELDDIEWPGAAGGLTFAYAVDDRNLKAVLDVLKGASRINVDSARIALREGRRQVTLEFA